MSLDFVESEDSECHENSPSAESGLGGRFGHFQLVGMGSKTNENCGQFIGIKVCLNIGKHNAVGENFVHGVKFGSIGRMQGIRFLFVRFIIAVISRLVLNVSSMVGLFVRLV